MLYSTDVHTGRSVLTANAKLMMADYVRHIDSEEAKWYRAQRTILFTMLYCRRVKTEARDLLL